MNFNDPLALTGIQRAVTSLGGLPRGIGPCDRTLGVGPSLMDIDMSWLRDQFANAIHNLPAPRSQPSARPMPVFTRGARPMPMPSALSIGKGIVQDPVQPVGDVINCDWTDVDCLKRELRGVVTGPIKDVLENQAQMLKVRALKAIGYKDHEPKIVSIDGKVYALLKNQLGVVKKIGPDGSETDYTAAEQTRSQVLSASGQWMTGAALGVGLVAAAAVLFLLMRRK